MQGEMEGAEGPNYGMRREGQHAHQAIERGPQSYQKIRPEEQPHQTVKVMQQRQGEQPNQYSIEEGEPQVTPQPSEEICHKIHLAVDPDVMEYVSTSTHNVELKKIREERQITINWSEGDNSVSLEYSGEKSKSWETKSIHSFLNTFGKCDLPVHKEVWTDSQHEIPNICDNLGDDSLLIKCAGDQSTLIIVTSRSNIERYKEHLKVKLAKMYKKATFQEKKISSVSKSLVALLKAINFPQKLQEKCQELEVILDEEKQEIRLEGPKAEVHIAIQEYGIQEQAATKNE